MPFPNTKSLAYFVPRSQLIFLNEINAVEVEADFAASRLAQIRHSLSTVYHEVTHWADTVGTLWGNEYLKLVYAAYDVMPKINVPGNESKYYRFIDLHDSDRRLSFANYYRTIEDSYRTHSLSTPWKISFSCGIEFNANGRPDEEKPIIFVRFGDHHSGEHIVRQPLSIAALLETTATWSEISTQLHTIAALGSDERKIEEFFFKREYGEQLYTPELTLYSAPVHLLAHYARINNITLAYHLGALLSLTCLNLVGSHFRQLKVPTELNDWGKRIAAFRKSRSITFAFMCICMNASKWGGHSTPIDWVDEALTRSGLPTYNEILGHATEVLRSDVSACVRDKMSERQVYLRRLGADWLDWRRAKKDAAISYSHVEQKHLKLPVIFDASETAFTLFGSDFDIQLFDPIEMFEEEASLHTQTLNFWRACR